MGLIALGSGEERLSAADERSLIESTQLVTDGLTATVGYPITRLDLPQSGAFNIGANSLSKLIGVASVGLAIYGTVDSARQGDASGVFFNGGALVGSILAFSAPGPGTAIALGFTALSLAYNQHERVQRSNEYTTLDDDNRGDAIRFATGAVSYTHLTLPTIYSV